MSDDRDWDELIGRVDRALQAHHSQQQQDGDKKLTVFEELERERLAADIANKAVRQVMAIFEVDPDKPSEIREFRQDMVFLRELRETFKTSKRHAFRVILTVIATGFAAGLWKAFNSGAFK